MDLRGMAALVTGGSGDLGGAISRALARAGADVSTTVRAEKYSFVRHGARRAHHEGVTRPWPVPRLGTPPPMQCSSSPA